MAVIVDVDLEFNIALYRGPLWLHETMLSPHFRLKTVYKKGGHYCEFTIPQHIPHTCNYYYYWEVNGYSYHHRGLELTSPYMKQLHFVKYGVPYMVALWLLHLTIAHKVSRVRGPGTHCLYSIW